MVELIKTMLGPDTDWKQVLLMGMSPIFLLAFMLEYSAAKRRKQLAAFHWKEIIANLLLGSSYQIAEAVAWLLVTGSIFAWVYQYRLFDVPVNAWTVLPIFVLVEFCYYWFHRSSH